MRNGINIKEATMPGPQATPKPPAALQVPIRPTDVLSIAAKPLIAHSSVTDGPRTTAKPYSNQ